MKLLAAITAIGPEREIGTRRRGQRIGFGYVALLSGAYAKSCAHLRLSACELSRPPSEFA